MRISGFTRHFYRLYVVCAFSDLIDGPIARKNESESELGAHLDTVGDVLTYPAVVRLLIMEGDLSFRTFRRFVLPVILFITSVIIGFVRFHKSSLSIISRGRLWDGNVSCCRSPH